MICKTLRSLTINDFIPFTIGLTNTQYNLDSRTITPGAHAITVFVPAFYKSSVKHHTQLTGLASGGNAHLLVAITHSKLSH